MAHILEELSGLTIDIVVANEWGVEIAFTNGVSADFEFQCGDLNMTDASYTLRRTEEPHQKVRSVDLMKYPE